MTASFAGSAAPGGARRCYIAGVRDKYRKPRVQDRRARRVHAPRARLGDPGSRALGRLATKLGNDGVDRKVKQADGRATELLDFVTARLAAIHGRQTVEIREMAHGRRWHEEIAKGYPGHHLADAGRWHESARLYKEAAVAICNGNLGRGAQLLDRAIEAERAALDSLPKQVADKLHDEERAPPEGPGALAEVSEAAACTRRGLPQELVLADRVLARGQRQREEGFIPLENMKLWFERARRREEEEADEDDED